MILPDAAATAAQNALKALESASPTTIPTTGETKMNETATTTTNAASSDSEMPRYVAIPMTPEIWAAIQERLPENTPIATFLRTELASSWGVQIEVKSRSKYASKEEAKAAQKAKAQDRNALIKALLAKHRAEQDAAASAE